MRRSPNEVERPSFFAQVVPCEQRGKPPEARRNKKEESREPLALTESHPPFFFFLSINQNDKTIKEVWSSQTSRNKKSTQESKIRMLDGSIFLCVCVVHGASEVQNEHVVQKEITNSMVHWHV